MCVCIMEHILDEIKNMFFSPIWEQFVCLDDQFDKE